MEKEEHGIEKKKKSTSQSIAVNQSNPTARTGHEFGLQQHGGLDWSPLLRIAGRDKPIGELLQATAPSSAIKAPIADKPAAANKPEDTLVQGEDSPTVGPATVAPPTITVSTQDDYAQIDLKLSIQPTPILSEEPRIGVGYAGFTPTQRYHFLHWLGDVRQQAPAAFQALYLAHLETNLFDEAPRRSAAANELLWLSQSPNWQTVGLLWRVLLLRYLLQGDGNELQHWLAQTPPLPANLLGIALGILASFGHSLTVEHLPLLQRQWQIAGQLPDPPILRLRLAFLEGTLHMPLLQHAFEATAPASLVPKPWRCAHRSLRITVVQPDLRPTLLPLLTELSTATDGLSNNLEGDPSPDEGATVTVDSEEQSPAAHRAKQRWQLVLEFGDSRSEFFDLALRHAQQQPGYLQIMDENRRMIHRITFEKSALRRFWYLWEYVQSWSSTQVYMNGKELQKWEIYPYSPYLR
ncbi:MAG: hypothetical protein R2932_20495 [Caldilineaceae bacterium]